MPRIGGVAATSVVAIRDRSERAVQTSLAARADRAAEAKSRSRAGVTRQARLTLEQRDLFSDLNIGRWRHPGEFAQSTPWS